MFIFWIRVNETLNCWVFQINRKLLLKRGLKETQYNKMLTIFHSQIKKPWLCSALLYSTQVTWAWRKCRGKHEPIGECFSLLLECSSRFLCALQQNRAQSRLLCFFNDEEQVVFFRSTLFSKRTLPMASWSIINTVLKTLIKNASLDQLGRL